MADALMAKLTGSQTGGEKYTQQGGETENQQGDMSTGGRRHRKSHSGRKGHKSNSWLAHVKATMKLHPGKSFKQILKIAKKTYKRSQSQSSSQSGGRKRKGSNRQNQNQSQSQKNSQNGGSGGKMAGLGESAAPYV